MKPEIIQRHYDKLAKWFQDQHVGSNYGIAQLERAIGFCDSRGYALDVGCGSSGRFLQLLFQSGFQGEGVDISAQMIELAAERRPDATFYHADICTWIPEKKYDLITAWDSTFHLPFESQEPVLTKLCQMLTPGGVILFTCGSPKGEITGEMQGLSFGYSSLGAAGYVAVLEKQECRCLHLEHDQWPESHVFVIAKKL